MISDVYSNYFYGNGRYVSTPYNQLISNTDQAAGALGTAYAVTYDTTDFPDGISVTNNSRITFAESGVYNITYSGCAMKALILQERIAGLVCPQEKAQAYHRL